MPTASKLFAALAFGLLGWVAAAVLVPALPEGTIVGWLREISFGVGLVSGWHLMGRETGRGFGSAIGTGLGTALLMVVVVILIAAIWAMLKASLQRQYPGPLDAVMGAVNFALKYVQMLGYGPFLGVLVGGGALLGAMTEAVGRRWS